MPNFDPDLDIHGPGLIRINYAFADQYSAEHLAHEADVRDRQSQESVRKARRRDVPSYRKPPANDVMALASQDDHLIFPQCQNRNLNLALASLRRFPTGIRFDLVGNEPYSSADSFIGERINLTHRIRPPYKDRIYLGIVLDDGKVVSNKTCTPPQAPEDGDRVTPWLYGGRSFSRQSETGATYFLSPTPPETEQLTFTIAYPEHGIDRACSITVTCGSLTLI